MPPVRGPGGATGEEQLVLTPDSNREGPPMIIPGNGPGEGMHRAQRTVMLFHLSAQILPERTHSCTPASAAVVGVGTF